MDSPTNKNWLIVKYLAVMVVLVVCALTIVSSVNAHLTTGLLKVGSSDKKAAISVTEANHQAKFIGVGDAKVRLKPGEYQVAVSDNGEQAFTWITINKEQTSSVTLNPGQTTHLPSVQNINFQNIGSLVNSGLTAQQITKLELYLFTFKKTAQNVDIDSSSIVPVHNSDSIAFSINFSLTIDGAPYTASISYASLTNIHLVLYGQTGQPVLSTGGL